MVEVGGVVQKVWFKSTETGYAALRLRAHSPRGAEAITVVGTLAHVAEGQALQLQGSWKRHPQYGRQLAVSEAVQVAPRSDAELALYLASGVLPGVGQVTAKVCGVVYSYRLFGGEALVWQSWLVMVLQSLSFGKLREPEEVAALVLEPGLAHA